jgi:hypothetical protein
MFFWSGYKFPEQYKKIKEIEVFFGRHQAPPAESPDGGLVLVCLQICIFCKAAYSTSAAAS